MGRKKQPHYRVVVAESRKARDGRFVETLGYYKPLSEPARLVLDLERVDYWIGQGALPSDTVGNLISKARAGGDDTVAVGEVDAEAERAKRVEELAAKRAAEKKAAEEAAKAEEEAKKAEAEAAAEAAAAEAAEEQEGAAEDAGETEPVAEGEGEGEAADEEETSE
jgi:small subunit ribosomal protein S16